jgi:formate/nitrite transporter
MFGLLAGIYIAFGAAAALAISSAGPATGVTRFLAGTVFSVGLMLVLIPGAELFTGNILMVTGIIDRSCSMSKLIRNWLIVYAANFIGSLLLVWIFIGSGFIGPSDALTPLGQTAANIANAKMSLTFTGALCRGILCNILVCLAVITSLSAKTLEGKILGIYFPIMVFVVSGYEHSIANMFFLPLGLAVQGELWSKFMLMLTSNLIPVTIGNMIGGILVVVIHPKSGEKAVNTMLGKN